MSRCPVPVGMSVSLLQNIRRNRLSIISLLVALTALGYNSWRNEQSEANRNVRAAGFEIIRHVGELQRMVFLIHYDKAEKTAQPRITARDGWAEVMVLRDLGQLMPEPVAKAADALLAAWSTHWQQLADSAEAEQALDQAIALLRERSLASIRQLD